MYEYLADNFANVEKEIVCACEKAGRNRGDVRLIAVTKTHPVKLAQAVIDLGQADLGENRPQEIVEKNAAAFRKFYYAPYRAVAVEQSAQSYRFGKVHSFGGQR